MSGEANNASPLILSTPVGVNALKDLKDFKDLIIIGDIFDEFV